MLCKARLYRKTFNFRMVSCGNVVMFQTGEQGIQVGEDDPVGEALVELQDGVQRELDKSIREVERAHAERDNVRHLLFMFLQ